MDLKNQYLAFVLSGETRDRLRAIFPPKFQRVVLHHVTVAFNLTEESYNRLYKSLRGATWAVVGYTNDSGLEALVVEVNGGTQREDGSTYHVTLSLAPGRKPVESNAVINTQGWVVRERIVLGGELRLEAK